MTIYEERKMVVPTPSTKTNIFMDEVLNFLAEAASAEQILAFKPSEALAHSIYLTATVTGN